METAPLVLLRHDGPVAWITLNRPERLNSFAGTMRADLLEAIGAAAESSGARVIAITGAGRAFCAGADVQVMQELLEANDERGFASLVEAGMRVVLRIRSTPKLVVAAINGVAAGAGAALAAACDLRIAADDAQIGFGFNRIGLHPDWGSSYTLPRLVGPGRAAELVYTGRMLIAEEARQLGLVDRVAPAESFRAAAADWVAELATKPPLAIAAAKQSLERTLASDLHTMLAAEGAAQLSCFRSRDVREGMAAFREKRTPRFAGE